MTRYACCEHCSHNPELPEPETGYDPDAGGHDDSCSEGCNDAGGAR